MKTAFRSVVMLVVLLGVLTYVRWRDRPVRKDIETPIGVVSWKELPGGEVAAFVRDLSNEELTDLDRDANRGMAFVEKYAPAASGSGDLLERLDAAFAAWLLAPRQSREKDQDVIRITGAVYGRHCVNELGLKWAMVRDEHGMAMSLIGENPTSRSFPFTSIQYRIEDGKTGFFGALFYSLKNLRDEARK